MATEPPLKRELTSLLEALPSAQLVEITRRAALGSFQAACRGLLGGATLESTLAALFKEFSETQIAEVAREMALCAIRNSCWNDLLSLPGDHKLQLRCRGKGAAQRLRERTGPAIVTFWHYGATHMVPLGLQKIGVPALIIVAHEPGPWFQRSLTSASQLVVCQGPRQAAIALKAALDWLRKGGVVVAAIDGSQGQKDLPVEFLGRQIPVTRGPAVLARLTGAPIFSAVTTWGSGDWSLDFRLYDPLPTPPIASLKPEAWELAVLSLALRHFESIVHAHPGQFRLEGLAYLAKAPRVGEKSG